MKLAPAFAKLLAGLVFVAVLTFGTGVPAFAQAHNSGNSANAQSGSGILVAVAAIGVGAAGLQRRRG